MPRPSRSRRSPSRRWWHLAGACAALLVFGLTVASCARTEAAGDVASLDAVSDTAPPGTTAGSTDPDEAMRSYAACMRDHGIDMPDPQTSDDGKTRMVIGGRPDKAGGAPDMQKTDAADQACQHFLDGVAQGAAGKLDPAEAEAMKQQALDFSKCMRDHGVDMPDPQFDQSGGGARVKLGRADGSVDPSSPAFKDAQEACSQYMPQGAGLSSGGPDGAAGDGPSLQQSSGEADQ